MKKALSLVLALALTLSIVAVVAHSETAPAIERGGTLKVGKTRGCLNNHNYT
jgi:hypothetical protein